MQTYLLQLKSGITLPFFGEVTATYHTLWFNLNNISGINSVKVTAHTDDNDKDTNYSDFAKDIKNENGITASVNLSNTYLTKIREDYDNLIPIFKTNKDLVDSYTIQAWIGNAIK